MFVCFVEALGKACRTFDKGETFHLQNLGYGDESFVDDREKSPEDVLVGC